MSKKLILGLSLSLVNLTVLPAAQRLAVPGARVLGMQTARIVPCISQRLVSTMPAVRAAVASSLPKVVAGQGQGKTHFDVRAYMALAGLVVAAGMDQTVKCDDNCKKLNNLHDLNDFLIASLDRRANWYNSQVDNKALDLIKVSKVREWLLQNNESPNVVNLDRLVYMIANETTSASNRQKLTEILRLLLADPRTTLETDELKRVRRYEGTGYFEGILALDAVFYFNRFDDYRKKDNSLLNSEAGRFLMAHSIPLGHFLKAESNSRLAAESSFEKAGQKDDKFNSAVVIKMILDHPQSPRVRSADLYKYRYELKKNPEIYRLFKAKASLASRTKFYLMRGGDLLGDTIEAVWPF